MSAPDDAHTIAKNVAERRDLLRAHRRQVTKALAHFFALPAERVAAYVRQVLDLQSIHCALLAAVNFGEDLRVSPPRALPWYHPPVGDSEQRLWEFLRRQHALYHRSLQFLDDAAHLPLDEQAPVALNAFLAVNLMPIALALDFAINANQRELKTGASYTVAGLVADKVKVSGDVRRTVATHGVADAEGHVSFYELLVAQSLIALVYDEEGEYAPLRDDLAALYERVRVHLARMSGEGRRRADTRRVDPRREVSKSWQSAESPSAEEEFMAAEGARLERDAHIERAGLSHMERQTWVLSDEGYTYPEIAERLGIAVGTIKSLQSRARGKLRDTRAAG